MLKDKKYIIYLTFILVLFIVGCSPENRYKVLSFLFDGVPDPNLIETVIDNDSLFLIDSVVAIDNGNNNKPLVFLHQPYQIKDCNSCHSNTMGQTIASQPGMCYTCHENFEDSYAVIHGPAAGGYCTSCHDPHKSKKEHLLKREDQEMCFHCHDQDYISGTDLHSVADISNCSDCHNPHGEENSFLIKDGVCKSCHEDFKDSYKYLHGPVASGYCNSCHDTHDSKSDHKLLITGRDLCFKCHTEKSVYKNENHEGTEDYDCMECHNPHGGEDKYILN